jgi:hypothetical protein
MVANYPMGPIFDGAGLNMTVMSYRDQLDFGLQSSPDLMEDPWELAGHLEDALAELAATVPELEGQPLVVRPFADEPDEDPDPVVDLVGADSGTVLPDTAELLARAQEALDRAQADREDARAIAAALEELRRAAAFAEPA